MTNKTITSAIAAALTAMLLMTGCQRWPSKTKPSPARTEAAEYDCLKHAKDGICEIPVNGKVVLYCVKAPFKRTVRYREDCK